MKNSEVFFIYLNDYLDRLKLDLKSEKTIETYKNSLIAFKNYLVEVKKLTVEKIGFRNIDDDLIRGYLKYLIDKGLSLSTRNIRLTSIKNYISFCADKDITILSLFLKVSKIKTKKASPKKHNWINKKQLILLLEQTSLNKIGIRDRFIMMFMFGTGARLDETLSVKLGDIHITEESYVLLRGKGNKTRIVPLTAELIENLQEYLRLYHPFNKNEDYLFYVYRYEEKHKMSQDNVQRIIKKYNDMARKVDDTFPKIHPHMLRHSYGAILYREHLSKAEIAKLMGHEREETTERYVETDEAYIRDSLKDILQNGGLDLYKTINEDDKHLLKGR